MDPNHFGEFIKLFSVGNGSKALRSRKAAATLFSGNMLMISSTFLADLIRSFAIWWTRCPDSPLLAIWRAASAAKMSSHSRSCCGGTRLVNSRITTVHTLAATRGMPDEDPRVFQGFLWADSTSSSSSSDTDTDETDTDDSIDALAAAKLAKVEAEALAKAALDALTKIEADAIAAAKLAMVEAEALAKAAIEALAKVEAEALAAAKLQPRLKQRLYPRLHSKL
jgi:hypothetical protein